MSSTERAIAEDLIKKRNNIFKKTVPFIRFTQDEEADKLRNK